MTKRLRIVLFLALAYFLIIIPVQSQQDVEIKISIEAEISGNSFQGSVSGVQENTGNEEIISGWIQLPETLENMSGNNFETGNTGEIQQKIDVPALIISEVYYDGTEEWIEITNLGSDFSGTLQILVPQSIFFSVYLQPNQSIILTKSAQTYSRISPLVFQQLLPLSFSFTDTKAIFISLYQSGQLVDIFQADTGFVVKYNDKKTSLIKQNTNQIWSITGSISPINVLSPYIASPGIWESGDFFTTTTGTISQTGTNSNTGDSGNTGTGDFQITSGSDLGGEGMTGHVEFPIPASPQPGTLSITEIYQSNGLFSDFIEIQALQDFSGKLYFSGSLLKTRFNLDFSSKDQERTIIVYSDNGWLSDQKKTKEVSLELNTSGFLQVLGQSGQVFDTLQILASSGDKSNYNGYFSNGDIDIFSKIDNFSPGFDEKFLVYFKAIYANTTGQVNQNTGFFDQTNSGVLSTSGTHIGQDLSGEAPLLSGIQRKDVMISALSYKTPEQITITSYTGISVDLSKKDRYLLTKETFSNSRKTTKKYLTGILFSGNAITITKSFGFLDDGCCVGLFYQTIQIDEYCYQPILEKKEEQKIITGEQKVSQIPHISLIGLLPNPQGKDIQEQLLLFWSTTGMDQSFQLAPKTLYLLNNKTKTYLSGSLQANTGTLFKGSLGLLNRAHCTELRYTTIQLDRFCYPNPKEDEPFASGNTILQTVQKSDFSLLQKVGFIITGSQICVNYQDQMLTCRQLPAAKTSIKLKNENRLYKTYVGLLQNYLIKNRSTLYFNTPITQYFTVLKNAKAQVKDFSSTISISGYDFNVYDLSGQIQLTTTSQGLSGNYIQETISWRNKVLLRLGL